MRPSPGRASDAAARHERFARAVDGGVRDVSDPEQEGDLAVAAALRRAGTAASPRADEIDRMRQRVLAGMDGTGRDDDRGDDGGGERATVAMAPSGARTRRRHHRRAKTAAGHARGRLIVAAAASLCLLMALSAMSLVLSQSAVPGDPLYAFKRTAESAEMRLTFGPRDRALQHLEFASTRISEIAVLAQRSDGSLGGPGSQLLDQVLDDFDSDVVAAMRLMSSVAGKSGDTNIFMSLSSWAQQQQQRLRALRDELPVAARSRVNSTLDLLGRVQQRAAALAQPSASPLPGRDGDVLDLAPTQPVPAQRPGPTRQGTEPAETAPSPSATEQTPTNQTPDSSTPQPSTAEQDTRQPLRDTLDDLLTPGSQQQSDTSSTQQQQPPQSPSDSGNNGLTIPLPGPDLSISVTESNGLKMGVG